MPQVNITNPSNQDRVHQIQDSSFGDQASIKFKLFERPGFTQYTIQEPIKSPRSRKLQQIKENKHGEQKNRRTSIGYHLYTVWLFTFSDLKTIVGPKSAFGILNALRASAFHITSPRPPVGILTRLPLVLFWTWINLLPFAIDNQRQPAAIKEDGVNKAWRPLPSGRLNPAQAKNIMLELYPIAFLVSTRIGGTRQCLALVALGYWYNDRKGGDKSCVIRNLINACGFLCYTSGAMEVALGSRLPLGLDILKWFLIIGLVVFFHGTVAGYV